MNIVLFEVLACSRYTCQVIFNLWLHLIVRALEIYVKNIFSMLRELCWVQFGPLFPDVVSIWWWINFPTALCLSPILLGSMQDQVFFILNFSFTFLERFPLKSFLIVIAFIQLSGYSLIFLLAHWSLFSGLLINYGGKVFQIIAICNHRGLVPTWFHDRWKTLASQTIIYILFERKQTSSATRHAETHFIWLLFRGDVPGSFRSLLVIFS